MARQIRNPEARVRVVEAAWRVVAAEGTQGATMRGIAAEAGVTTGFVTHYFTDKQELLAAVLEHNNRLAGQRVVAAIGERRGLVALEDAAEALLPIDAERRRAWQVWVASWRSNTGGARLTAELRDGRRATEETLRRLLAEAVEDGELPGTLDVAAEAERLVTLIAGTGLIVGVESPQRVRRAAKRMLAGQVASLERQGSEA